MEDNLVTVAIHTYEKAQILKSVLEAHGIEAYIQNVNQILPVVSAGVRVRIRESDLARALGVIEAMDRNEAVSQALEEENRLKTILVPVDFSDYSTKAYEMGFRMAAEKKAEVVLLHAYYNPSFNTMPIGDVINYDGGPEDDNIKEKVEQDVEKQKADIDEKIANGTLPKVNYQFVLREGVPEEEIARYAKDHNPLLIIMGTRGKDKKDQDLIGSVTAEIIDHSMVPVFAIPENAPMNGFDDIKSIAYATNFDDKDLVAFDKLMQVTKPFKFKIHFIHYLQKENAWSEIKLRGIKDYFAKYYPNQEIAYDILRGEDMLTTIDNYIKKNSIDAIAITTHKRNIFTRLFNPSVARKMVFHSNTPMLVFHA
ncbi:MAG: universal stress protein [Paludibacteraceae bacterium]|nr:universal stress protein [Paludibacteraceae bacterium]MBR4840541.1 universal stress protein [Paludibacteraceae bacterium]